MPAIMGKPSLENFSPKGKKFNKKEGGGSGSDGGGSSGGKSPEKVRSKKRGGKRSFLEKAKRFGKQGRLGKGTEVDSETYSYYVRILELLRKDDFDTDEDRDTLVENALKSAEGTEVQLSSNQLVSRVIENILPLASEDQIDSFCQAFTPSLRVIVSDPFASHVLEKLLELTSSDKWKSSEKLTSWFEKTSMFILNNFEDFTFDKYGSFVTKKVLECLSGHVERPTEGEIFSSKGGKSSILRSELYGTRLRKPEWEKMLQDFGKRFAAWPQFNDLGQRAETSRLLQNVMQTVKRTQKSEGLVKDLILRVLGIVPETVEADDSSHRILEVALTVADDKTYGLMYNKYYKGKLAKYIIGPCFTLQKVISEAPNEKLFSSVFDELAPTISTMMQEGRTVIIYHLAIQCGKFGIKQKELWTLLKDAFKEVRSSSDEANLLMTLVTIKSKTAADIKVEKQTFSSTFYGSATVQQLIDFSNPVAAEVLTCFDELDTAALMKLALDPKASFIISKIFKSWSVPQKPKEKLLEKIQRNLVELATTKFGSRIIDLIWLWANVPQKTTIATVLSHRIPVLTANKYGRFLVETLGLQFLVRNQKEWMEHIASQEKRKKEAEQIGQVLGLSSPFSNDDSAKIKKAKKRKSEATDETPEVKEDPEESTKTPKKKKNRKSGASNEVATTPVVKETEATETPKKKKKNRKSEVPEPAQEADEEEADKKSKKKNRKSQVDASKDDEMETNETPKKKKGRKSEGITNDDSIVNSADVEIEDTPKKKKKNRKSEKSDEGNVSSQIELADTPNKKKKKDRKSKQF